MQERLASGGPSVDRGIVYLVGAGPGDPKLITVGGKEALNRADVVFYDRLAHPKLLDHAPASAERIFAGKMADRHIMTQDEINSEITKHALAGKTVVRLKGGDPFVFGRGGEEAEYLRERGISYVVIPGISSSIAAPAYAGIPVTHRADASSFAVITGHERADNRESATRAPGEAEQRRRWDRIAYAADTLIFLMGVESIAEISARLIENGRAPETPVAMIRWGTWAGRQETLTGTLGDIAQRVAESGFKAPAVTVVGDVVRWREHLQWWDNRPLSGKRIIVTRAREQASALVDKLTDLGAEPIEFPTIRIQPPSDNYAALDEAIRHIGDFDWLVVASANAVSAMFDCMSAAGLDSRALHGVSIAAVGPATADSLLTHGIRADFVPDQFTGEDIARNFPTESVGQNVLIVSAAETTSGLRAGLAERGANITSVVAYETVPDMQDAEAVSRRLDEGTVDMITFTSSSTVKNFAAAFASLPQLEKVTIACIGPSTAQTAREVLGREADIVAEEHTVDGLIRSLTAN